MNHLFFVNSIIRHSASSAAKKRKVTDPVQVETE